ncbi:hypothetical protein BC938DRAFT_470979 [Jimgerdemannia flammicorona]|uniref:Uncharacterized protein n=1 Tax=Jimgerdemannia flammicorona TaxID=994334 RepID=A0A433Q927_9FUNG|nr:hypothetical protein BC938DRAFT_470979 [Jimgerdemannia flammicorona]
MADSGKLRRIKKEIDAVQKDSEANIDLWMVSEQDLSTSSSAVANLSVLFHSAIRLRSKRPYER